MKIYLTITDSYKVWDTNKMKHLIIQASLDKYSKVDPEELLNRSYKSMYIEWWIHNIGYYMTLPFNNSPTLKKINIRCKDVDIEQWETKTVS